MRKERLRSGGRLNRSCFDIYVSEPAELCSTAYYLEKVFIKYNSVLIQGFSFLFSISKDYFVVAPQPQQLSVYQVAEITDDDEVVLNHVCYIESPSRLFLWKIWKSRVICAFVSFYIHYPTPFLAM